MKEPNTTPPNNNKLSPVERYLLAAGYDPEEIDGIEQLITSGIKIESDVIGLDADRGSQERRGIEAVWKTKGVLGVIEQYRDFVADVGHFFYSFRTWEQIQQAFADAELTPLASQAEIETACGPDGLALPSVTLDGALYFDFKFVGKSDEAKKRRASELSQAREEVLRYLVGKS